MKFLEFKQQFKEFNAITYQDIVNVFDKVNVGQLSLWKQKGYLKSVRKGMYILADSEVDNLLMANELNDSYISLEFALSFHQIIPEISQAITSVSNDRPEEVKNDFGIFYYYKISSKLFTGFILTESIIKKRRFIRIAEVEKALFDLIYLRSDLKNKKDFESLRLNLKKIKISNFKRYVKLVEAESVKKRLNSFINYYNVSI